MRKVQVFSLDQSSYESDPENEKIKNVLNNSKDTLDKLKITFVKMNDFIKTL